MDFINKISETYRKMLGDNKFLAEDKFKESYELFKNNYALAGQYMRFAKQANMSINNFTRF